MKIEDLSVLYAEDEPIVAKSMIDVLKLWVKKVYYAQDGEEALKIYNQKSPDILLLDITMPNLDGLSTLKIIRQNDEKTQAIMLTARDESDVLLLAVEQFITRYIVKPIKEQELLDALKLAASKIKNSDDISLSDEIKFNPKSYTITKSGTKISIGKKEHALLQMLLKRAPNVATYSELKGAVYGSSYSSDDALKAIVKELRKKIGQNMIKNISGIGYALS